MYHRAVAWILCGICVASLSIWRPPLETPAVTQPARTRVDFRHDILPILSSKCFTCHGPDPSARKAGLRLDQRDLATKKARSGATPIVPGDVEHSELLRRILADDDER